MPTELFENNVNFTPTPPFTCECRLAMISALPGKLLSLLLVERIMSSEEEIYLGSQANTIAQIDCFCFITILYFNKVNQIEESRGEESNLNWQVSQIIKSSHGARACCCDLVFITFNNSTQSSSIVLQDVAERVRNFYSQKTLTLLKWNIPFSLQLDFNRAPGILN